MASSRLFLQPSALRPSSVSKHNLPVFAKCSSLPAFPESCPSLPPQQSKLVARRSLSATLLLLHCSSSFAKRADAVGLFDKYVKRKKLDPLEAYVPAVLLTQEQFKVLEKSFDLDEPNYDLSRSLLRSGPAASLRVNIRAVAQYASDDGKGKSASEAVDECLRALEDLDSILLHASRKDLMPPVATMRGKINIALDALDSLLQTVPTAVLDKGRAIADAYRVPSYPEEGNKAEELDKDIKELEAIL